MNAISDSFHNYLDINRNDLLFALIVILIVLLVYISYFVLTFEGKVVDLSDTKVSKTYVDRNDLPPSYPNGWIPVLESKDIQKNQIKNFNAFGHQLVAFRGSLGSVYVLDAYCPHMGANVGVGGKIVNEFEEECIRCPFHGWTFRGRDGLCVRVPNMEISEIPKARIKVWECIERNGILFVWYHLRGLKPEWFPFTIKEIEGKEWRCEGRTEHTVVCHFQEIPENGADGAHIQELHTPALMAGTPIKKSLFYNLWSKLMEHKWESKWWTSEGTDTHMAYMTLDNKNQFFGYTLFEINFKIRQMGPAFVELRYTTSALGGITGTFIQMLTPIEPNLNRIVHHIYTERTLRAKLLAKFLLIGELKMIERDVIIWNNKKFLRNPIFTKNEKSLVRFRRWFNQFYSEEDLKQK